MKLSKISPIVRAVAVIGATAGLVTGVTFAALQSNTVALSPNTLSSASALLSIGSGTSCPQGNTSATPGFTNVKLVPGVTSAPVAFCLDNTGDIPLNITAQVPDSFSGSQVPADQVTLTLSCPTLGNLSGTLNNYFNPVYFPGLALGTGPTENCNATVKLDANYTNSGQTVNQFDIKFFGTQVAS